MSDPETDRRHAIALFRYGLIAELVHLPPGAAYSGASRSPNPRQADH